jgi:hypothetical protein
MVRKRWLDVLLCKGRMEGVAFDASGDALLLNTAMWPLRSTVSSGSRTKRSPIAMKKDETE